MKSEQARGLILEKIDADNMSIFWHRLRINKQTRFRDALSKSNIEG